MTDIEGTAVAADGGTIWFRASGDGPEVVLVSGLGSDETVWDTVLPSLGGFRVIVVHNRGIGRSSAAPDDWSTRDSAGDVMAVLDALRIERAHVYGHSLGGRIAQWIAIDHPDRVRRLVLGATTVGDAHGVPRPAHATEALQSGDPARVLQLVLTPEHLAAHPEAVERAMPRNHDDAAAARQLAMSSAHDAWAELPSVSAPTLVVHGVDDGLTDVGNARVLAARIPGADLLLLAGVRHAYMDESPTGNTMVAGFLRAPGPVDGGCTSGPICDLAAASRR